MEEKKVTEVNLNHSAEFKSVKAFLNKEKSVWDNNDEFSLVVKGSNTPIIDRTGLQEWLFKKKISVTKLESVSGEILKWMHDNCNSENQKSDKKVYIGTQDLLDQFMSYLDIQSGTNIFMVQPFPMKNYHLNSKWDFENDKMIEGTLINSDVILTMIEDYCDYLDNVKNISVPHFDKGKTFDQYVRDRADLQMIDLINSLAYEKQKIDYLKIMIESFIEDKTRWDGYYLILKHWMWCVKRRALNRPTIYEMLPVFTGAQGTGKSTLINLFVKPFEKFILKDAKVSSISEERSSAIDSTKLIWVLDEMAYADKTSIAKIKTWITSEVSAYRPMNTNSSVMVKKRSMAIGSQNPPLSTILKDSTGNRRFADYPIKQAQNEYIDIFKKDHKYYNEFQADGFAWEDMWKDVDENLERGYVDLETPLESVMLILDDNIVGSIEYQFWKDVISDSEEMITVRRFHLYSIYCEYCKCNGYKSKANNSFISDFENVAFRFFEYKNSRIKGVPYCTIPKFNYDYYTLISRLKQDIPGIMDGTEQMYTDKCWYNNPDESSVEFRNAVTNKTKDSMDIDRSFEDNFKPESVVIKDNLNDEEIVIDTTDPIFIELSTKDKLYIFNTQLKDKKGNRVVIRESFNNLDDKRKQRMIDEYKKHGRDKHGINI